VDRPLELGVDLHVAFAARLGDLPPCDFDPGSFALRIAWLPWQSWHSGAFVFPFAIAWPCTESKYARTLSDWGAPSRFPLKWQWVQVTRLGCSRCGISLTSKWQSVHTFFPCTEPASVSR